MTVKSKRLNDAKKKDNIIKVSDNKSKYKIIFISPTSITIKK